MKGFYMRSFFYRFDLRASARRGGERYAFLRRISVSLRVPVPIRSARFAFSQRISIPFCALLFSAFILSCASVKTDNAKAAEGCVPVRKDVREFRLSNGIPLYVRKNTANRKLSLSVIVKGGTSYLSPETSGLEKALFDMMTRGSEKYTYDELRALAYETGFSILPQVSREGAVLSMSCIDYYFDKVLPVFADAFLHPSYNPQQYKNLMTDYAQEMQRLESDPESMLAYRMTRTIFKDHPYATSSSVKPESIGNITVEAMRFLHERDTDARRIMIVAVGNYDEKKLLKKLDAAFGSIPTRSYDLRSPDVPPLTVSGEPIVIGSKAASGTGYLEKAMSGPSLFDDDMLAASLAASMYSQVLFNVVREKYGACYSPSASVIPMRAGLANVFIFKASDLANVVRYEKEAQAIFASGKVIDGKNDDGTYIFSSVADRLRGYKNQYVNSFYASSVTNAGVASRLTYSLLMFGDPYAYDEKIAELFSVSADDVLRAFRKYWVAGGGRWFCVVGPEDIDTVKF